ncbi:MAG: hypothetical protein AAFY65_13575 [Pseudomonadota bacterium]
MLSILKASLMLTLKVSAALIFLSRPTAAQGVVISDTDGFLPRPVAMWAQSVQLVPWISGGLAIATVITLVGRSFRRKRKAWRLAVLGLRDGPRFRAVDAMVHAAWSGGQINEARLERALEIARNTTAMDYELEHLREAAMRADRFILPMNFHWMARDLCHNEKLVIFNSVVSVLLADGALTQADKAFLRVLTRGLGLNRADLRDLSKLVPH